MKKPTLLARVERLEERVDRIEPKVDTLTGINGKLDIAVTVFSGLSERLDRLYLRQTVCDNHVFGLLRSINPTATVDMDPPLTDDEVHAGGTA